jgi:cell division protein FtsW
LDDLYAYSPPNFSTAALLGLACWIMMFVGRVNLKYLLGFTGLGIILLGAFIVIALQFKNVGRVHTWINRIENLCQRRDNGEGNYQVEQSKLPLQLAE